MDGRSFEPFLKGGEVPLKEAALIEYQSIYGGDDGKSFRTWPPRGQIEPLTPVRYTDSGNNTYVALRILNSTHDILYAEFAELTDWDFKNPYFYELFDQKTDPYQKVNIYKFTSQEYKAELRMRLHLARTCKGRGCHLH